jgi:predicted Ser/Thr protein kinase
MTERFRAPIDREGNARSAPRGDDEETNAQRAKRRRAAPVPSDEAIDAADLRLLESLPRELGLRDFRFLARGHKGVVYVAEGAAGRVAIKVCRDGGARQEERWLRRCNDLGIGASLLSAEDECVVMEYVEGPSIGEALDGAVPPGVLFKALRDLLAQCAKLDKQGIDKREMNRCQKHVIVSRDGKSTLLDFERCQESSKASNVTGLAQYLTQAWAVGKLRGAGASADVDGVRAACKSHKKAPSDETLAAVERALGLKSLPPQL